MDDEDKRILLKLLDIAERNNRILRKLHRHLVIHRLMRLSGLLMVIVIAGLMYYFAKPYLGTLDKAVQIIEQFRIEQMSR